MNVRALFTAFLLSGCVAAPHQVNPRSPPATPAAVPSVALAAGICQSPPPPSLAVHWYRDSAEQKAAYEQTYRIAASMLAKEAVKHPHRKWAVVLDVDETILDNSELELRLNNSCQTISDSIWDSWVYERHAVALPGAVRFIDTVMDKLHGQVILITNRTGAQCPITEQNLDEQHLRYDRILCDDKVTKDKNQRFAEVQEHLPVLMFIGDNIRDFPRLDQAHPGDMHQFGSRYFVLPNPMYGSWIGNPSRQ